MGGNPVFSHCPQVLSLGFPLLRQSHPFPGGGRLCMSVTPGRTILACKCSSATHPYQSMSGPRPPSSPPRVASISNTPSPRSTQTGPQPEIPEHLRPFPFFSPPHQSCPQLPCPLICSTICPHPPGYSLCPPHTVSIPPRPAYTQCSLVDAT